MLKDRSQPIPAYAHAAVAQALRRGELVKTDVCEVQSDECRGRIEAAHYDYAPENRLRVRWLCKAHHERWDAERFKQGLTRPPRRGILVKDVDEPV